MTIQSHINIAIAKLRAAQKPSAELDARLLLIAALNKNRHSEDQPKGWSEESRWTQEKLLAHPEAEVPAEAAAKFEGYIARRLRHEPVALILGQKEFYGLMFKITPDVLQPRPESEAMVEAALVEMATEPNKAWQILDIGTGCGALTIALNLAAKKAGISAQITATDVGPEAVALAQKNAATHSAQNITFIESNLLEQLPPFKFDIILANLPYIPDYILPALEPEVQMEPKLALLGGSDGLELYRALRAQIEPFTTPKSLLIFECAHNQAPDLRALFHPYRTHIVT